MITETIQALSHVSRLTYAAIAMGLFIAAFSFRLFFPDLSNFWECLCYSLRGQRLSDWLNSNRMERDWGEMKLFVWVALSAGCGILSYYQLPGWFPGWFAK